jgi:uncharacterized membrane protein HdeD (DUF308 family)
MAGATHQRLGRGFVPAPAPAADAPLVVVALTPEEARRARTSLLVGGVLALVVGVVAILVPAVASVAIDLFVGVVLMTIGVVMAVAASAMPSRRARGVRLVEAVLAVLVGICLVAFPLTGTLTLTFFLATWFIATGVLLAAAAWERRGRPGFAWGLLNGAVSVVLGVLIALSLPSSAGWAIGLLVGINLVMFGLRALVAAAELKPERR